jgi:hypothetical protein
MELQLTCKVAFKSGSLTYKFVALESREQHRLGLAYMKMKPGRTYNNPFWKHSVLLDIIS